MLKLLWPQNTPITDKIIVRLGRIAHWLFTGLSTVIVLLGIYLALRSPFNEYPSSSLEDAVIIIGIGILAYIPGRAIRYVLAGE